MMTGRVLVASRAQPAADLEARHARQHPVEDDEVGRRFDQPQFGLVAAFDRLGDVALGFEVISQQQREIGLVFDDEDARSGGDGAGGLSTGFVHGAWLPIGWVS
jgi:hypothetical protein